MLNIYKHLMYVGNNQYKMTLEIPNGGKTVTFYGDKLLCDDIYEFFESVYEEGFDEGNYYK